MEYMTCRLIIIKPPNVTAASQDILTVNSNKTERKNNKNSLISSYESLNIFTQVHPPPHPPTPRHEHPWWAMLLIFSRAINPLAPQTCSVETGGMGELRAIHELHHIPQWGTRREHPAWALQLGLWTLTHTAMYGNNACLLLAPRTMPLAWQPPDAVVDDFSTGREGVWPVENAERMWQDKREEGKGQRGRERGKEGGRGREKRNQLMSTPFFTYLNRFL